MADTVSYLEQRAKNLDNQWLRLTAEAVAVKADFHKFKVAEAIAEAELPAGSFIHLLCWDDEPNEDGSYDICMSQAYDDHGDPLMDMQGEAYPMGWADGDYTDIDEFLLGDAASDDPIIDVDRVHEWIKVICSATR